MNDVLDVKSAIKETLPTVFGYLGIGIAFGVVGKASGLSVLSLLLTSLLIYAGSAQFIVVSMLLGFSPILSIMFAVFLVNSRMILMSTTLAPYFKTESLVKNILVGTFLTDESFALGVSKLNYTNGVLNFRWFNVVNIISYLTWCVATLIGALVGNFLTNPEKFGLDFAIVAMFIGLLLLQIDGDKILPKKLQYVMVFVTFVLIYVGFIFIPSNILILLVTLLGCGIGVVIKRVFY